MKCYVIEKIVVLNTIRFNNKGLVFQMLNKGIKKRLLLVALSLKLVATSLKALKAFFFFGGGVVEYLQFLISPSQAKTSYKLS